MYEERREKLLDDSEADCAILINVEGSSKPSLMYYTGFTGTFATLVISKGGEWLITDSRYTEQALKQTKMNIVEYKAQKSFFEFLSDFIKDRGCKKIGIEKERISLKTFDLIFKGKDMETVGIDEVIKRHRMVKNGFELEKIRKAIEIAQKAFLDMLNFIKPGRREREISAYLEYRMKSLGAEGPSFDTIIASGYRSAMPHGVASDKTIEMGDLIVVDFGSIYEGYVSDITRMVSVGEPTEKMREIHSIVLEAQRRAIAGAKPGMSGSEIDALSRKYIEEAGFGGKFGHGLGHGIGLEIHEAPRVSRLGSDAITKGMVFTIEPGIYLEGSFGVRIEDDVLMKDDGVEVLTSLDREIFVVMG